MIKDVETNSERYDENPTWNRDILDHRKKQFSTERGFRFADIYFNREKGGGTYTNFDKNVFEYLKGIHKNKAWYPKQVSCVSDHIDAGHDLGYLESVRLVAEVADKMNITNKTVLVIGTEVPWMETILLQRNPRSRELYKMFCVFNLVYLQEGSYCRVYKDEEVKRLVSPEIIQLLSFD